MFGRLRRGLGPPRCYAICAVARSGAHFLTSGLQATRRAGRPLQYFHAELALRYAARFQLDVQKFPDYVQGLIRQTATPNRVFGFRIECWDLPDLIRRLREGGQFGPASQSEIGQLQTAFPGFRCILLTRDDKLRQAISKARALQSNLWVGRTEEAAADHSEFDPALIAQCLRSARHAERAWGNFFARNALTPLALTYEDLCRDYNGAVRRIMDFLEIELPKDFILPGPKTVRQADAITEEWVERYRAREAGQEKK